MLMSDAEKERLVLGEFLDILQEALRKQFKTVVWLHSKVCRYPSRSANPSSACVDDQLDQTHGVYVFADSGNL